MEKILPSTGWKSDSTVLHMFVEGIYNMKTGPDLSIQVPLSNLKNNKDAYNNQ